MGLFYTNITLKGPTQGELAAHLTRRQRDAYVSPSVGDITVVYDKECEWQDQSVLESVASDLSGAFHCPALVGLLHDDDVFMYTLADKGRVLDHYNSEPAYFDDSVPPEPSGDNAALLCRAFGREQSMDVVDAILYHYDEDDVDDALMADDRHRFLAEALGFPPYAYGFGYDGIEGNYLPEGIDRSHVVKTGE